MPVKSATEAQLVSSIYDAAVEGRGWNAVLLGLADRLGCVQVSLNVHDRASGVIRNGVNPFMEREYRESFLDYWQGRFTFWKRSLSTPIGRILRSPELFDEAFWKTPFYQEWTRPQGVGPHGRYCFVASGPASLAMLRAVRPSGAEDFGPRDDRLFGTLVDHFIRGLAIDRRLRLAEAQRSVAEGATSGACLLIDGDGRVLAADEPTVRCLHEAGLISVVGGRPRIDAHGSGLEQLIRNAARRQVGVIPGAGQWQGRSRDGRLLNILIVPVEPRAPPVEPWFLIDQPAALLFVSAPEEAQRARVERLAAEHGLTPAEAAVAVETAKGDGRAAVAARLGIRETTVRSHLSTIFDKLGIHRQAELARIISGKGAG